MQAIAKLTDKSVPGVLSATIEAFLPILTARKAQLTQTPKKTFKYGSTDRHQVRINAMRSALPTYTLHSPSYYPPSGTSHAPILFFVYGGGFTTGSRDVGPGAVYDGLGSFFAQRGILTVIADYRLAPETLYPDAVHDVSAAIQFALNSPEVDVVGAGADKSRVYLMGHSAGGAHLVTMFLNEDILGAGERSMFKGAVLNCGAYESAPFYDSYYGETRPRAEIDAETPLGLLKSKSDDRAKQLLPSRLFNIVGENDEPILADWGETFKTILRKKGIAYFQELTMRGHNHISSIVALNSGEGEEWGEEIAKWIKA